MRRRGGEGDKSKYETRLCTEVGSEGMTGKVEIRANIYRYRDDIRRVVVRKRGREREREGEREGGGEI